MTRTSLNAMLALCASVTLVLHIGTLGIATAGDCGSTTQVPGSNYTLTEDWTTATDVRPCFRMESGRDLNLNGFQIKCTKPSGSCSIAVQCAAANSIIQSTEDDDGTHIDVDGPFQTAIQDCSQVQDLVINNNETAISSLANDADKIRRNAIIQCGTRCIDADMQDDADRIEDNFLKPGTGRGIRITGKASGNGPAVQQNVIFNFGTVGIEGDSTHYRVQDNVIAGNAAGADAIAVTGSPTSLVCEDDAECDCDVNAIDAPVTCLGSVFP
jgi:hypothetical protein